MAITRFKRAAFVGLIAAFSSLTLGFYDDQFGVTNREIGYSSYPLTDQQQHLLPIESINDSRKIANTAVGKGQKLLCLLPVSAQDATSIQGSPSQSPWTDYSSLQANGWSVEDYNAVSEGAFDELFEALNIDPSQNVGISLDQDQTATVVGQTYEISEGRYRSVFNVEGGVIVADDNLSPTKTEAAESGPVVPLHQWSDVVFLQWNHIAASNVGNLKYIFRALITNEDTKSMVDEAFQRKGETIGAWEDRVVFGMDTEEGQAILGSPNGSGVAWILINHKDNNLLGIKTIQSVTVWQVDSDSPNPGLAMYFTIL
ncbi:hypothetical protein B7463_g2679, partial [Scytalidium lignicola]